MKVLVMGGTLFNGYALVNELVKHGHEVTICNRGKTKAEIHPSVRRLIADRTDHVQLKSVLGGEDFDAIHDISAYHPEDVEAMVEIFHGRTGHYIFASSTVIYAASDKLPISEDDPVDRGPNQNEYGLHKLLCEDILIREWRERGFPASIVPFSMVFGPRNGLPDREQRMFGRLLRGRKILIPGDGLTLGQIGHVEDQARALRMMMQKPQTFGRRYNLTGADYFTNHGYVDTFAELLGVEPQKVSIPAEMMDDLWDGKIATSGSPVESSFDIRSSDGQKRTATQRFALSMLIQRLAPNIHRWNRSALFSIERLKHDTGWQPEYSFKGAVAQTWDWMKSEGIDKRDFDFTLEDELLKRLGH